MGWNTPDDCPWPSDMDYYEDMRRRHGPEEERDEEERHYFGMYLRELLWRRAHSGERLT